MTTVEPDRQALRAALHAESTRVAALARTIDRLDSPVPGLAWSVGQLVAHLCVVYQAFARAVGGDAFSAGSLDAFGTGETMPQALAVTNARTLTTVPVRDGAHAADLLAEAAAGLLAALHAEPDVHAVRHTPWYGPGTTRTVGTLAALAVSETLVHGYDLAGALGADRRLPAASAATAAPVVLSEMLPLLVDPVGADGFTGSFELRIRAGQRFVVRVADGAARTGPADGQDVDCVLALAGWAALLLGFRRIPVWRAMLSGGVLAFGRRPWLGLRFPTLFLSA